jgi:hypothetical protein
MRSRDNLLMGETLTEGGRHSKRPEDEIGSGGASAG